MSVLFVVSRLQDTSTVFKMAERSARAGMKVIFLFLESGCIHATDHKLIAALSYAEGLYCLKSDSLGLRKKIDGAVSPIDYGGLVELIEACDRIVSWA